MEVTKIDGHSQVDTQKELPGGMKENMEHPNLVFSERMRKAVNFSIKTHELDRKQKRKVRDVPFVVHPLAVAMILARVRARENVIIAGTLHDTIEDSDDEHKVSSDTIAEQFGSEVAEIVNGVTEPRKDLPWEERKRAALEHISALTRDGLLVKSADLITNVSDILDDFAREGDAIFAHFNAPKDKIIAYFRAALKKTREQWPENPLANDLLSLEEALSRVPLDV